MASEGASAAETRQSAPTDDAPEAIRRARWAWRALFPTPALALLMAIGLLDLLSTALLHRAGMIVEVNPIMRFFIVKSEWLFAFAKGITLGAAWGAMAWYARTDLRFVTRACLIGSAVYVGVWCVWFFGAR